MTLLVVVLVLTALLRLNELRVSSARRRDRAVPSEAIYPLMVLVHVALFVLTPLEVLLLDRPFLPALAAVAMLVLAGAVALRVWVLRSLGSAWNVRVVRPDHIVSSGPYALVRHPNYVVVVLELLAIPLIHTAWITAAALSVLNWVVLAVRIRGEERVLFDIPEYRKAMSGVPRFIPTLRGLRQALQRALTK